MLSKVLRFISIFILLTFFEAIVILVLSLINIDELFVRVGKCLLIQDTSSCSPLELWIYASIVISVNIFLSSIISTSGYFDKKVDWQRQVSFQLTKLQKLAASRDEIKLKQALIDVDKLLDYATLKKGIKGKDYFERVGNLEKLLPRSELIEVKIARKVRNRLVHEVGFEISREELHQHFWAMRKAILRML